jgi:glucuronate isomerase
MKAYIHDDFLLSTDLSKRLYHDHAEKMPIFDYHSHLNIKTIAENQCIPNLGKAWLDGDHYKWRAVRATGIDEDLISGTGSWRDKFMAWAKAVPNTIGNPIYQWTHMELKRYFDIDTILTPETAGAIYEQTQEMMQDDDFKPRRLLQRLGVKYLSTTDDPIDSLEHHRTLAADKTWGIISVPAFRPDKAMEADNPETFNKYMDQLAAVTDIDIVQYVDLIRALDQRHQFFHDNGCRFSDHALERPVGVFASLVEVDRLFVRVRSGEVLRPDEVTVFQSAVMLEFGRMAARRGWIMQLHIAALRNINTAMYKNIGPGAGGDCMADGEIIRPLARFLDLLEQEDALPKTVLYTLNPMYNDLLAAIAGCFNKGPVLQKLQFGPPWWFNDTLRGIESHFETLAAIGTLPLFIGMTTDTNSFYAYPRHEYFRRILSRLLASWVDRGEIPGDAVHLGKVVENISFNNAEAYFALRR